MRLAAVEFQCGFRGLNLLVADVLAIRARAREKYIIYVLPYVALVKQKQENGRAQ